MEGARSDGSVVRAIAVAAAAAAVAFSVTARVRHHVRVARVPSPMHYAAPLEAIEAPRLFEPHARYAARPIRVQPSCPDEKCYAYAPAIERHVKRRLDAIARCYESALLGDPTLAGRIELQLAIARSGDATIVYTAGFDDGVASCVMDVVRAIQFPEHEPFGDLAIMLRFDFPGWDRGARATR